MRVEVPVEIDRPVELVWPVLIDVERWPEWTASMTEFRKLDQSLFGIGSRVFIRQPRLKAMVWHLKEYQDDRLFTWEARSLGVTTIASHAIRTTKRGSIVNLTVEQRGWLAPVLALLLSGITRRYMEIEAQSLKRCCEALPRVVQRAKSPL